jgi:predicted component of type VI protein secretion system
VEEGVDVEVEEEEEEEVGWLGATRIENRESRCLSLTLPVFLARLCCGTRAKPLPAHT